MNASEPSLVQIKVGSMQNFAYILSDPQTKTAAVIDPGWDVDRILSRAESLGLSVRYIINTHGHFDHISGNLDLVSRTGAKVIAHGKSNVKKDIAVRDGDCIKVGAIEIKVVHTPGHSPDHICLLAGRKLLTGDTLFVGECGRTDLEGSSSVDMYDSLFNKLLKLDDKIEIYPGHDYGPTPHSTIGTERRTNYVLAPRTKQEFVDFMASP